MNILKRILRIFSPYLDRRASHLGAGLAFVGLALLATTAMAEEVVILDGDSVVRIEGLEVVDDFGEIQVYDVEFISDTGADLYGSSFDFPEEDLALSAIISIQRALNENNPTPSTAGPKNTDRFYIPVEWENGLIGAVGAEYFGTTVGWDECEIDCPAGTAILKANDVFTYAKFRAADGAPSPDENFVISLEEPVQDVVMGGIGNLRGWAVSDDGIDRVEMWLNGAFLFDVPYGGERTDVQAIYPETSGSLQSGYSLAYGYSNLGAGTHTMTARAYNKLGEVKEASATFTVVVLAKDFIPATDEVSTEQASASFQGDEVQLNGVSIDGQLYDLLLKWRTAEQGFEIIEADF